MGLSKKPYRGTRDFFPDQMRIRNFLFKTMAECAESFGYEPYDGPLLEETELYYAKSGEELINEQIYSFKDRGDRDVAIRPEMTPTLARMVAQVHREVSKPLRWYSIPNLMRYEKPQRGRLREHWQFNCDLFGAPGRGGEIEIIQVLVELLERFGASSEHFEICFNDREIIDRFFSELLKVDQEKSYQLYKILDRAKKVPKEALEKMVSELSIGEEAEKHFYAYLEFKSVTDVSQYFKENQIEADLQITEVVKELSTLGYGEYLNFDPSIVRGLDYYTGLVFEAFDKSPENRRAICGGGSYANLLQIFNEPALPGIGFGLGDVTLTDFLQTHQLLGEVSNQKNDIYVTFQSENASTQAKQLAREFRKHNLKTVCHLETLKMKKVFSNAEKLGAKNVVLFGDNEVQSGKVVIKNLASKEQVELYSGSIEEMEKWIRDKNV